MDFELLIKRLSPKLKGIVHKVNWRCTFFDQDDLYQEALVHLWTDYQDGKLIDKTDSYVLQGCQFHLKNYMRKNYGKAKLISLDSGINEEGEAFNLDEILSPKNPESCFETINTKLLIEKINNNGLTKREKEVFNLALEGLTTREIGGRLGISHVRVVKLKGKVRGKCIKYVESF